MLKRSLLYALMLCISLTCTLATNRISISSRGLADGLNVFALAQDEQGLIWYATDCGLYCYDGYDTRNFTDRKLGRTFDMKIYGDTMYIACSSGLHAFSIKRKCFIGQPLVNGEKVRAINGDLVGASSGLYRAGKPIGFLKDVLSISRLGGNAYVGTINSFSLVKNNRVEVISTGRLFESRAVELGQMLLVGTLDALLFIDKNDHRIKKSIEMPVVKTMLKCGSLILIGTDDGLYTLDKTLNLKKYTHNTLLARGTLAGNTVWSLLADKAGNIWIGTDNGISIVERNPLINWVYVSELTHGTQGNKIDCFLADSKGRLWLGGTNGLICITNFRQERQHSRWFRMDSPGNYIPHNRIHTLYEDDRHRVWMGCDGGLFLYNETSQQMRRLDIKHYPAWTYDINQDKQGNLRVAMNDTLYVLNPITLHIVGTQGNTNFKQKQAVYTDALGREWFAAGDGQTLCVGGVDCIGFSTKQRLEKAGRKRELKVTGIKVNGQGYVCDSLLTIGKVCLKHGESSLVVRFTDLNYGSEHFNQYYYLIDGLQTNWQTLPPGSGEIPINYLPPGSYHLYISSAPNKKEAICLQIRMAQPWYFSPTMLLIYAILVIGLIVTTIVYFMQRKTLQIEKLEKTIVIRRAKKKERLLQNQLVAIASSGEPPAVVAQDDSLLHRVTKTIDANLERPEFNAQKLSEAIGINQKQLYRKLKALTGMTTVEYICHVRLERAATLLGSGNFTIAEVMYRVGFTNASYFSRVFVAQHGMTPTAYKKQKHEEKKQS